MTETVSDLIKEMGGPQRIAGKLNSPPSRVHVWASRGAIPRPVWPDLIAAYPKITLARLRNTEPAKPNTGEKA
jgi:hypothetical protein